MNPPDDEMHPLKNLIPSGELVLSDIQKPGL